MQMKCPYCGSEEMVRAESLDSSEIHVLTSATKTNEGFQFHPDNGIPVRVIYCNNCKMVNLELASLPTIL